MVSPKEANPIDVGSGNKYQVEIDYQGLAPSPLFARIYNSSAIDRSGMFGANPWRSTYDRAIKLYQKSGNLTAAVMRADGKIVYFNYAAGQFTADAGVADRLTFVNDSAGQPSGFSFLSADTSETETYDQNGRLTQITTHYGVVQNLSYNTQGKLSSVTDTFGKTLNFTYDSLNRVITATDPAGGVYHYAYGENNNLVSVAYPDAGVRQYLYENNAFPNALTGIIDENGKRFATWAYDDQGRAISSEHAGGAGRTTFQYGTNTVQINDALNAVRAYTFETALGVVRKTGQTQPAGSGCGAAAAAVTYDVNGHIASYTNFNGTKTTYEYDLSRNLETKRIEAAGTAVARTITTTWHPTYRLPAKIAGPKRITTNNYDNSGNLLSKTEQATMDTSGAQAFSATVAGSARTWKYTYNNVGQMLTAADPLGNTTTYSYDSQGNLATVTNAAGQVTSYSNYDANGRVGRIVDPNGLITDLSYSPRGWLTSKTVGGETTSYTYDGAGQLIQVRMPDGSAINSTYDDAHRLTGVADSGGNSISYTLDAMGNRIVQQVKDPNGTLTRQITRVYDALNRLQQATGGT